MSKEHKSHLLEVLFRVNNRIITKYVQGQKEHGGKLWEDRDLLDEALNEMIDGSVYLVSEEIRKESIKR
jgi:hypothetical protein